MDENSCEGETSEGAKNVVDGQGIKETDDVSQLKKAGVRIEFEGKTTLNQVSERRGSSIDASVSGPSTDRTSPKLEDEVGALEAVMVEEPPESLATSQQLVHANDETASTVGVPIPILVEPQGSQQHVRMSPCVEEQQEGRTVTVGPPPSYSFVMKQKKKSPKPTLPDTVVTDRPPPPPTYSGNRGLCLPPEDSRLERVCNLPSLSEPLWRSHSQPALCPRCGIIILTTIHSHDSIATHVAALALCLFGCWPCCLLPYCMNICKNTYHHCPICQSFLGAYSPW